MSRSVFTIVLDSATIAGATSLIVVRPPSSGTNLELVEAFCGQQGSTTPEQCMIQIGWKASAYQTVVSQTPNPIREGGTASVITGGTAVAAGTCGVNASAEGAGAFTPVISDAFSNVNGWRYVAMPDSRIVIPSGSSQALTLKLESAPTGLSGWTASLTFAEI